MLLDRYPPFLQGLIELRELTGTEQPEFDRAWQDLQDMHLDFSPYTLTERGCERWEDILGLIPSSAQSVEERRFAISARLGVNLPYTMRRLEQVLATLCGDGNYTIQLDEYDMTVRLALVSKSNMGEATQLVERMTPANIAITMSLLYNRYELLRPYTHARLAAITHKAIRDEVLP